MSLRSFSIHGIEFWLAFVLVIAASQFAEAAARDSDRVASALAWGLLPGGGHFYLDEPEAGAAYAGSFLSLVGAGIWLEDRKHVLDDDDQVNTFWLLGMKDWELSLFTTYREALRSSGYNLRTAGVDDAPVADLLLVPFRRAQVLDPMVLLAAAVGVAGAAIDARHADYSIGDVSRVGVLGADANQAWGTALYGVDAFSLSLAAGVSEEAVWRGVIQNELEFSMGERGGLWTASALFGAAHVVDLDGSLNGGRVLWATAAGAYLGYLFQQDQHQLARPIAAHFWYNFAVMMTSFALDPANNPLGIKVAFGF